MPSNAFRNKNKHGALPGASHALIQTNSGLQQPGTTQKLGRQQRLTVGGPVPSNDALEWGIGRPTQNKFVDREGSVVTVYAAKSKAGCSAPDVEKINQDAFCLIERYGDLPNLFWFSVMDGHGMNGHLVSDVVRQILYKNVQECPAFNRDLKQALQKGFFRTNCELFQPGIDITMSGTTCVACVLHGTTLYSANVGDSRAIMGRSNGKGGWTSLSLSHDHKPDRPDEEKRILAAEGRVAALKGPNGEPLGPARVWRKDCDAPGLAMSRSLGDSLAASVGVIGEPEILVASLTPQDDFIVIASDGLWEFMTNEEVAQIVSRFLESKDPMGACDALIEESNRRWRLEDDVIDDTTVVVIFLDVGRKDAGEKRR
ncbi:hypothetical protein NCLIV_000410 [Neospora caninum Liverpool]|uniref:Protein phosphatase 2c containing protein n=1 Tax=Neospora caninum (strain Liverpool) TaxID=572307 RepID=F0V752_NEOCL|nr:hypothetical protein NCLIV_000410 [Neospora caninum Liverpool]CBZ49543.1 hypothetical protein NCLIV_000410 [Neospora caninum Liverpool]CEL64122.1 TPA: protein phosphatase 2c containing protein [Neospora caninum Liverpool]|eukprot:XP_003879578.1 hypothetical protein NCLIV_000410 [Neospora caninum Liverpool]